MGSEWGLSVRNFEVDNGWSLSANGSTIEMTNNGFAPNLSYDTWQNTSTNPNQDTLAMRIGISNNLLEKNGNSAYDPFTFLETQSSSWSPTNYDPIIVLTGTPEAEAFFNAPNYTGAVPDAVINEAFVGRAQDGFNSWSTTGPQYALVNPNDFVIPEPTTPALLGLGAACLACRRFRRGRRSPSSAPVPGRL